MAGLRREAARPGARDASLAGPRPCSSAPAARPTLVFTVYPVLRTFYNSVHTIRPQDVDDSSASATSATLLTADPVFWKAVGNTAIFTIVGTVVDVLGGLLLALCLFAKAPLARSAGRLVHAGADVLRRGRHHLGVDLRLRLGAREPASCAGSASAPSSNPGSATRARRSGR